MPSAAIPRHQGADRSRRPRRGSPVARPVRPVTAVTCSDPSDGDHAAYARAAPGREAVLKPSAEQAPFPNRHWKGPLPGGRRTADGGRRRTLDPCVASAGAEPCRPPPCSGRARTVPSPRSLPHRAAGRPRPRKSSARLRCRAAGGVAQLALPHDRTQLGCH